MLTAFSSAIRLHRASATLWLLLVVVGLAAGGCSTARSPVVSEFQSRYALSHRQLPKIIEAADAAAAQIDAHPDACINVPYRVQSGFAEEVLNRAGGLANALPSIERRNQTTPHDVSLVSVRAWDDDGDDMLSIIEEHKKNGWTVVLFASEAGKPEGLDVDYLIDNGGADGSLAHGGINTIANSVNAWLWTVEYAAALTRRGRYPGVLMSIFLDGNEKHNAFLQRKNRKFLGETDVAIPAGELAEQYFASADRMIKSLNSEATTTEIDSAAAFAAEHIQQGGEAKVATCLHMLMFEIFKTASPITAFHGYRGAEKAMEANLDEGDLLIWIGYVGMTTPYEDYGGAIAARNVKLISSFTPDLEYPERNQPTPDRYIAQHWALPDAEVKIPFAPDYMAPISGIEQALLFRMLDGAIATKLADAADVVAADVVSADATDRRSGG